MADSCVWHLQLINHGKQTIMGCMKDFRGLFNIQVSSEQIIFVIHQK